jgi:hypothetical protein
MFVAVGHLRIYPPSIARGGAIWTSSDGIRWEKITRPETLDAVTYVPGRFLVAGHVQAGGTVKRVFLSSPDGRRWSASEGVGVGENNATIAQLDQQTVYSTLVGILRVTAVQSREIAESSRFNFIALNCHTPRGRGCDLAVSSDLKTWETRAKNTVLKAVTYGNGLFVGLGERYVSEGAFFTLRPMILTTQDPGDTWTFQVGGSDYEPLHDLAFGNGLFVAVGAPEQSEGKTAGASVLVSSDGIRWRHVDSRIPGELRSVAFGNGFFVAVGSAIGVVRGTGDGGSWTIVEKPKRWKTTLE